MYGYDYIQLQLCSIRFKYNYINVQLQIMYMPRGLINKPVLEIKTRGVYLKELNLK